MALHDFYPRPRPRPIKPIDPFPLPPQPPEPATEPYYPTVDKQEAEYIIGDVVYNGITGRPIYNISTGVYYF